MARISNTTAYSSIIPTLPDYFVLTDAENNLNTKTCTLENLQNYLASNNRVAVLLIEANSNSEVEVSLRPTDYADALNSELSDINFMLGFELPGDTTNFRIISDSRNDVQVDATAVFVSDKPYLYFSKILKRRGEAEIVFKGTTDSVYSEIYPVVNINYP